MNPKEIDYESRITNETLRAKLAASEALAERLKQEAKIHSYEARAANATIAEIYQAISGKSGDPGNWNGARPVIEYIQASEARVQELEEANRLMGEDLVIRHDRICTLSEALRVARDFIENLRGMHVADEALSQINTLMKGAEL